MKNILCYGDSNTYGFNPENSQRYDYNSRWTGILQNLLGSEYRVIEEGLNSRTTVLDDSFGVLKNGKTYFTPCIESHYPLDLIIIMLGSNDMKERFRVTAGDIAKGVSILAKIALDVTKEKSPTGTSAKVLLISPIHIGETIATSNLGESFGNMRAYEISRQLAPKYQEVAKDLGIEFMDASRIAEPSETDGLHLGENGHRLLGKALVERCIDILKE